MMKKRIALAVVVAAVVSVTLTASPGHAGFPENPIYGDFNNDGSEDIAYLGVTAPDLCSTIIEYGRPSGVFIPPVVFTYLQPGSPGGLGSCPDIGAAFNWEGSPGDELWIGWSQGPPETLDYNRLVLNGANFAIVSTALSPITPRFLGTADFDGNGVPTPYSYGEGGFASYSISADGSGRLGLVRWCSDDVSAVTVRDFNRDGAAGALISYTDGCTDQANGVVVALSDGTTRQLQLDPSRQETWRVQVVFANADRFPDIRTIARSNGAVQYFLGNGTGDFVAAPRAVTDSVQLRGSSRVIIDVLANDLATSNARVSIVTPPAYGTVQVLSDRRIAYTPRGAGTPDRFVYELTEEDRRSRAPVFLRLPS